MRKSVVLKNSLATCRYPKKSHSILIASGADDIGSQAAAEVVSVVGSDEDGASLFGQRQQRHVVGFAVLEEDEGLAHSLLRWVTIVFLAQLSNEVEVFAAAAAAVVRIAAALQRERRLGSRLELLLGGIAFGCARHHQREPGRCVQFGNLSEDPCHQFASCKELRARVSDIFLNLSLKAIDISGVSMVTTFLAEVPLAKSLTGVLKICGQATCDFVQSYDSSDVKSQWHEIRLRFADNDPSKDIPSHLHLRRRINMDT
ncbi:hypothetical protein OsJ_32975 [Oryza sativa Japonica Group]|uniref:Uncharacterized protein n=1 Tax=Oryza sativa subsp. japonica TaxID=39947 RepID=B9G9F2_ORYSJ|nr:hypothetical protein OsJ_32975 [Oryza sativa Japonica Group]